MKTDLRDMSLEELWELFPIVLTPHNSQWEAWANEEMASLSALLDDYQFKISHIGSTAVPDIQAKPIIDILVEVATVVDYNSVKSLMESNGYICMAEASERISFNKGYTPDGYAERVFHIHFHRVGDNAELHFRDYLIAHPDVAKEYEALKLSLLPKYKHNRDSYTDAKSDFINKINSL